MVARVLVREEEETGEGRIEGWYIERAETQDSLHVCTYIHITYILHVIVCGLNSV